MSYSDIRKMPIRYRGWYIDRFLKEIKRKNEILNSRVNKKSKKNKF